MAEQSRIDDLRRRVQEDPASIAFARLAEEYRRAGQLHEAVETCRAGLAAHPDYLSARVTLGRALLTLGHLDEAAAELEAVVSSSTGNLAAVRALAEARRRQGRLDDALLGYGDALKLAPNDPDLERVVREIGHTLAEARQREADEEQRRVSETLAVLGKWLDAIETTRAASQH
jgi:predicted Zn-dependent protease